MGFFFLQAVKIFQEYPIVGLQIPIEKCAEGTVKKKTKNLDKSVIVEVTANIIAEGDQNLHE